MRILVVDDEELALSRTTKKILEVYPFKKETELLSFARKTICGVAFLDIRIRLMTGIKLGAELKKINPNIDIIFATA